MLKEFFGISSSLRVLVETASNEIAECLAPLCVLKCRCILGNDKIQDFLLRLRNVGRLTISQLKSKDTEGPDIYLDIIRALSSDELGRHPANGADLAISLRLLLSKLCSISKVCQLKVALFIYEDVI